MMVPEVVIGLPETENIGVELPSEKATLVTVPVPPPPVELKVKSIFPRGTD